MSAWRKKAIETLPELKKELNKNGTTIFDVFIALLAATIQAHRENNKEKLKACYAYARWCLQQKKKDLWNSAGVVFYEHLGDYEETFNDMHRWVDKQTYTQVKGLIQLNLSPEKFMDLEKRYQL